MYGTTAQYNRLQFAHDMAAPADNWDSEDDGLPSSEYIAAKYRNQALIALMQMPEDELHDDLDEQTIEEWAISIAHENGESWI